MMLDAQNEPNELMQFGLHNNALFILNCICALTEHTEKKSNDCSPSSQYLHSFEVIPAETLEM